MTEFLYNFYPGEDAARCLAASLSFFGSLSVSRDRWARLLASMGWAPPRYLEDYCQTASEPLREAENIVVSAVPQEGDPHPQRALYRQSDNGAIIFTTPGGVDVRVWYDQATSSPGFFVVFGRDSKFASVCVLARLYESTGEESARNLLAQSLAE